MTNTPSSDQSKASDVPLEDVDKLLEAEDPEFTKSLEEVRSVEVDKNVVIEASVDAGDDDMSGDSQASEKPETKAGKVKAWDLPEDGELQSGLAHAPSDGTKRFHRIFENASERVRTLFIRDAQAGDQASRRSDSRIPRRL